MICVISKLKVSSKRNKIFEKGIINIKPIKVN